MLSVNNLTLRFGNKVLFDSVSVKFNPGYCYGLIGANGAGKTTFLRILSGEMHADEGEVALDRGVRMGVLKQDQYAYEDHTVLDTVYMGREDLWKIQQERDALYAKSKLTDAEGHRAAELEAEFGELDGYTVTAKAGELLEGLGIETEKHEWKMRQLAGGWKLRVLLAQVLYSNPDLLLLDEPTNHLDIRSIDWLEDYLNAYEGTILVISHDRHFLNHICTHIADVDRQKVTIYTGNYDFFVHASQQAIDSKMKENERKEKRISELKEFIARFSANASKSAQATSRSRLLEKIELEEIIPSSRQYPRFTLRPREASGKDVLAVRNLSKSYGKQRVLHGMGLLVGRGEKVAVLGANGLGKTTFLKCLLGAYKPEFPVLCDLSQNGHASDKGSSVKWGATVRLSSMPQDAREELTRDMTMLEWLRQFVPMTEDTQSLRATLGRMLFSGEQQDKNVRVLSGGECQRMMLARMMAEGGNVLLLDEPTNHMDLESIEALSKALDEYEGTVLFSSHDQDLISKVATRILELRADGTWTDYEGRYAEYLESQSRKPSRGRG
jgi:ATPase subunit of ABC transporter with duplicated ATPase domains